ncbi:MAG TPA: cyclodeaminase/cyclohydrolase family protein [Vicinamibacterales bacterium]|jgi:formiminotetrahydrofolate cyclodeaminase|nr:cyclodeaminase/cyclohydrolase family protein [Vicinamibacterales bacterium]
MPLTEQSIREALSAFSSADPTPGGGSASALASAVGASVLMMVTGLPKSRTGSDQDRAALANAARSLADIREGLTAAIDGDTAAYDRVVAAFKLPKASADEQSARSAAIQQALRGATDVPLGVMRLSAAALALSVAVAAHGHRAAASDVGVAVALLRAGTRGAQLNVEINLGSISDLEYAAAVTAEAAGVSAGASQAADEAEALL